MMRILSMIFILLLSACGNAPSGVGTGTSSSTTTSSTTTTTTTGTTTTTTVTGSVGDGPVTAAKLTFTDASGAALTVTDNNTGTAGTNATSTATGKYSVTLPATTTFPVTVTTTGGKDQTLVALGKSGTAAQPSVLLKSVVVDGTQTIANISPFTTLITETASQSSGGITAANVATAVSSVRTAFDFGLNAIGATFNPLTADTSLTGLGSSANLAILLQANEAMGEMISRTLRSAGGLPTNVPTDLAKDLVDGSLDFKDSTGTAIVSQVLTNLVQVRDKVVSDLYANQTIALGGKLIDGSDAVLRSQPSTLVTVAKVIEPTTTVVSTDFTNTVTVLKDGYTSAKIASVGSVKLASTSTTGQKADGTGSYTAIVQVLDGNGRAMPNQQVSFTVVSGSSGLVTLANGSSSLTTAADGTVTTSIKDVSSADDTVKINATVGGIITATPLAFTFTGTGSGASGGGVSGGNIITLSASTNNLPGDGQTKATITATLTDAAGVVLSGKTLIVSASVGNGVYSQPASTTNASGQTTFTVTDTYGESVVLTVSDGSTGTATITQTFISAVSTLGLTVSSASVAADGSSTSTITVVAKDNQQRPVANEPLGISVNSSTAVLPGSSITDANGLASFTVRDSAVGQDSVTVTTRFGVTGVVKSLSTSISFVPATMGITISAADPFLANNSGQPFTVTVKGATGSTLVGQVMSLVVSGSAVLSATSGTTDSNGQITGVTIQDAVGETVTLTVSDAAGKNSSSAPIQFTATNVSNLNVSASPTSGVTPDGVSASTVTAIVTDSYGARVPNAVVQFSTTDAYAAISSHQLSTDSNGSASVGLTRSQVGSASITVSMPFITAPPATKTMTIDFGQTPSSVVITASSTAIPADGATVTTLTATVKDANGVVVPGQNVVVQSNSSTTVISGQSAGSQYIATTDSSGIVAISVKNSVAETAVITISASNAKSTQQLIFQQAVGRVDAYSVVFSNAVNSSATALGSKTVDVYTSSTAADGYTSPASGVDTVQVTFLVRDLTSSAITGRAVSFSVTGALGAPAVTPSATTTNADGYATVTVTDTTAETVTVTAVSDTSTGTQQITFSALAPASIVLNSTLPSPATVAIAGAGVQESASLQFKVVDVNNNPVQGSHLIDFSIVNGGLNSGEKLTTKQSSTVNALASTVLTSGNSAGTVQVRASLHSDPNIFADATITITGGLPAGSHFSVTADKLNVAGRYIIGNQFPQQITATAQDFFSNPVVPGIAVQFQTDFAGLSGSGQFAQATGTGFSSSVITLNPNVPLPPDGFLNVVAQTTGGTRSKVLSLAVDPYNTQIIYAGTDGGGVFKSSDQGVSWKQVGTPLLVSFADKKPNLLGSIVRDLKIDPSNSATLYAATEKGVFVSTDSGNKWSPLSGLRRITGDVLATVAQTNGGKYADDGLWKNTTALPRVSASDPYSFPFHFQNAGVRARTRIYIDGVETRSFTMSYDSYTNALFGVRLVGGVGGTNLRNTTVSADYDTSSSLPPNSPVTSVVVDGRTYDPVLKHAKTIYLATAGSGVWRTQDGGKHWVKKSAMRVSGQSFASNVQTLAINSSDPYTILAGTDQGLFLSADGAETWNIVAGTQAAPLAQSLIQSIVLTPASPLKVVWVAGKNGVFSTSNIDSYATSADTWTNLGSDLYANDPGNTDVRGLAYSANNLLYAITYGDQTKGSAPYGGVYISSDQGVKWSKLSDVYSDVGAHRLDSIAIFSTGTKDTVVVGSEGRAVYIDTYSTSTGEGAWKKVVGTAPNNLTTTLFTTGKLMHSGPNSSYLQAQTSTYHPFPLPSGTTRGYIVSSPSALFNGESVDFYLHIADDLGNPLASGATVKATTTSGKLNGDTSFSITDTTSGQSDFSLSLLNDVNITDPAVTNPIATLSVVVTADNSSVILQRAITMIKGLLGISSNGSTTGSCASGKCGGTGTAQATGGSNAAAGYEFTSASQNGKCDSTGNGVVDSYTCVTASNITTKVFSFTDVYSSTGTTSESINVKDKATGQTGTLNITFTM